MQTRMVVYITTLFSHSGRVLSDIQFQVFNNQRRTAFLVAFRTSLLDLSVLSDLLFLAVLIAFIKSSSVKICAEREKTVSGDHQLT